jgi:DNA invertase Pin-like site-specific DNA recombinase
MQHFKDTAHSGRDLNRPQLQRLLHEVREGRVRHIVFTDSTRIARKFPDFLLLAERLTEQGCSFVSLDRINGTSTPTSRLVAVGQCALSHHDEEVPCEKA